MLAVTGTAEPGPLPPCVYSATSIAAGFAHGRIDERQFQSSAWMICERVAREVFM